MAEVARKLEPRPADREPQYWSPVLESRAAAGTAAETELCPRCGTEFIIGSRYCYVCGTDRDLPGVARRRAIFDWKRWLDFATLQQRLGMGAASLVAFIVGCLCLLAAALTGVMFTATTMIDWQAVQVWRIEWLLASIAAFIAGVLLKKNPTKTE
jgi:uncharacterized protein (DUF983 family)